MSTLDRRRPMIEVRHSPIHGYGVFALRRIRKGTTVIEYLGDRISHEEADERYERQGRQGQSHILFTVDSKTVIDAGSNGNEARFINHGCDPNCESGIMEKRVFIEAIRTIQPGEELVYDYQISAIPTMRTTSTRSSPAAAVRRAVAAACSSRRRRRASGRRRRRKRARHGSQRSRRAPNLIAVAPCSPRALDQHRGTARGRHLGQRRISGGVRKVRALAECAAMRRARGEFVEARIGADRSLQRREEIRGDHICWLARRRFRPRACCWTRSSGCGCA